MSYRYSKNGTKVLLLNGLPKFPNTYLLKFLEKSTNDGIGVGWRNQSFRFVLSENTTRLAKESLEAMKDLTFFYFSILEDKLTDEIDLSTELSTVFDLKC